MGRKGALKDKARRPQGRESSSEVVPRHGERDSRLCCKLKMNTGEIKGEVVMRRGPTSGSVMRV